MKTCLRNQFIRSDWWNGLKLIKVYTAINLLVFRLLLGFFLDKSLTWLLWWQSILIAVAVSLEGRGYLHLRLIFRRRLWENMHAKAALMWAHGCWCNSCPYDVSLSVSGQLSLFLSHLCSLSYPQNILQRGEESWPGLRRITGLTRRPNGNGLTEFEYPFPLWPEHAGFPEIPIGKNCLFCRPATDISYLDSLGLSFLNHL